MPNIMQLTKTNTTPLGPSSINQASPLRTCLCEYLLKILHFSANRSPTWSSVSHKDKQIPRNKYDSACMSAVEDHNQL